MLTGLSLEVSRFQARSALTGSGFTTLESEMVVNHPVRRRIAMTLMLLGSAGLVTVIATLILSFANADREQTLERLGILILALTILVLLSRTRFVDRLLNRAIGFGLARWTDVTDSGLARLLHLGGDYGIAEVAVDDHDWIAGRTLAELDLRAEGVAVLALVCSNGSFIGAPVFDITTRPGDGLILYGPERRLEDLDRRRTGIEGEQARVGCDSPNSSNASGSKPVNESGPIPNGSEGPGTGPDSPGLPAASIVAPCPKGKRRRRS